MLMVVVLSVLGNRILARELNLLGSGRKRSLRIQDGESLIVVDGSLPRLSGKHRQPSGFELKRPERGDILLVEHHRKWHGAWCYEAHMSIALEKSDLEGNQLVV